MFESIDFRCPNPACKMPLPAHLTQPEWHYRCVHCGAEMSGRSDRQGNVIAVLTDWPEDHRPQPTPEPGQPAR